MADDKVIIEVEAKLDKLDKAVSKSIADTKTEFESLGKFIEDKLENTFGGEIAGLVKKFGPLVAAIGATGLALKEAFDLTLEGEKLNSINAQFEVLTESAGLVGSTLKSALKEAAAGLVDDTDLIVAANKAIIELGANAKIIPETLELARKAASAFGGETVDRFEQINQALATGNLRSLRELGIRVDQEKALKKYADTLGASAATLTEAGRQQALQNAALEALKSRLENVDPNLNKTKNAFTEMRIAIHEVREALAVVFESKFSQIFAAAAGAVADLARRIKDAFTQQDKLPLQERIEFLNRQLVDLRRQAETTGSTLASALIAKKAQDQIPIVTAQIAALQKQLAGTNQELKKTSTIESPGGGIGEQFNASALDQQRAALRTKQAQTFLEIRQLQDAGNSEIERAESETLANQYLINAQYEEQVAALKAQSRGADVESKRLINEQLVLLEQDHAAKIIDIRKRHDVVSRILTQSFHDFQVRALAGGIQNLISNIARGKNAFEAFGKFILGTIGDFAIQAGTAIIAAGIGYKSLGDFTGTAPLIYGAALVALGALLKSFAGAGDTDTGAGSAPSTLGAGGGSLAGGGQTATLANFNPAQLGTNVAVNIQGNVLDRRETGIEIAKVLQEHFDTSGQVLAGATI